MHKSDNAFTGKGRQPATNGAQSDGVKIMSENQKGWVNFKQEISKTIEKDGKNVRESVGSVDVLIPTLAAFGINADIQEIGEDGLPVYSDRTADWLFAAVVQRCLAQSRNLLVNGTAQFKEGKKAWSNFEELTAEGEGNRGEALKIARECHQAFVAYFATLGKNAAANALAATLFKNREALQLQPEGMRLNMAKYVEAFAEQLSETDAMRYASTLLKVTEACKGIEVSDF